MVNGLNFPLFELVDFADVGSEDGLESRVVKAMEAVVGGGGEAPTFFVAAPGTRVKSLNAVLNPPGNGAVVAGVEVEVVVVF